MSVVIKKIPFESRYYGPYDTLLNYAMTEDSFTFFIAPQTTPDETALLEPVDLVPFLVVFNQEQNPVLFAENKDDRWASRAERRQRADTQICQRYDQMLHECPTPRLYGLSLFGTSLRVYCGDKVTGKVTPDFVGRPNVNRSLPSDFLEGQWNLDILSSDGFTKMQEIVAYIKAESG